MPRPRDYCNARVAKKLAYEYGMFTFLSHQLQLRYQESETFTPSDVTYFGTGSETDAEMRTTYALLESFLLHTRVLHDFFSKARNPNNKRMLDDVLASDFVPDWESKRPATDAYLGNRKRRERLDKALAHLTLRRVKYDALEKKWNVDAIRDTIEKMMAEFLRLLPARRKPWFRATT